MSVQEMLHTISDQLATTASVRNIYGDPVTVGNRTIIPVARLRYGFGGGGGEETGERRGGGGGGGVMAVPCGVLEVTNEGTRFIDFHANRNIAIAMAVGFVLGTLVARRSGRRRRF